jgi:hypothetical protein
VFRDGEKGDMLNIGVVFWVIRHEMMDVVILLVSAMVSVANGNIHRTTSQD